MPGHSFRHATIADVREYAHLREPDRPLFSTAVWNQMPALIEGLLTAKRLRIALVSDPSGCARMLGGVSFVDPALFQQALEHKDSTVTNALFGMAAEGRQPFLSPKQIAAANAAGRLISFDFSGAPDIHLTPGLTDPETARLFSAITDAYRFFHSGYHTRETWQKWAIPMAREFTLAAGYRQIRERSSHDGRPSWLFRFGEEDALSPGKGLGMTLLSDRPRLGFSLAEQELLEYALLGHSDAELGVLLGIGKDGVKKRWRAVHVRVQRAEPALSLAEAAPHVRRTHLLFSLRMRLEEIRPYRKRSTPEPRDPTLGG